MQREFGISCNYHKGYRARHIALEEVQGTPVESYSILPSYLYMLEQANPGTVTDLHTDSSNRFMYMFFCLKACIDGFLSSIRPVIVIDGTFLKGPHRGVLFVAVCMDGNEQIFPLAFGVGDSETNEAWEWFLTKLHKAVGEVDDLVIVSDRKGSITTGVEKVFPNSFHGACAVHLERNMVGHYGRNKALKQYFERAARVYRESQFLQRMEHLKNFNLHFTTLEVRSTTEKEAGDDVGVLLTETMASNLADEELVYHRSTTVASRRTHGRRLAGRATRGNSTATRRQLDGNSTATRRRLDGEVSGNWSGQVEKCKSKEDAEECLKKLSDEERDKLGVERLADISNVIYTSTPSNEDIAKRTDMLVTILVAAKGKAVDSFPPCIDCRDSIRKAYKKTLIEIASSKTVELQALDVVWVDTPC
ncbi:hypothetical protein LWI29_006236 [Acer saccharum]|uniref:MULE transposase domain-containing protein n=1 Tax=Acer saccharum TaxID=4024 RepID=A0AA39RTE4_ACESA|nr:hypothetical protein LWI29_006236 [Acer saccharum]